MRPDQLDQYVIGSISVSAQSLLQKLLEHELAIALLSWQRTTENFICALLSTSSPFRQYEVTIRCEQTICRYEGMGEKLPF